LITNDLLPIASGCNAVIRGNLARTLPDGIGTHPRGRSEI
jgi:hypothetical protein